MLAFLYCLLLLLYCLQNRYVFFLFLPKLTQFFLIGLSIINFYALVFLVLCHCTVIFWIICQKKTVWQICLFPFCSVAFLSFLASTLTWLILADFVFFLFFSFVVGSYLFSFVSFAFYIRFETNLHPRGGKCNKVTRTSSQLFHSSFLSLFFLFLYSLVLYSHILLSSHSLAPILFVYVFDSIAVLLCQVYSISIFS